MRKLIIVAFAVLALVLAGCTTSTTGGGNGQQKIDTQDFFPNDQDNDWQYQATGDVTGTFTWTVIDDPDYLLNGEQRIRYQDDAADPGDYLDMTMIDDETDSLDYIGLEFYNDDSREKLVWWSGNPYHLLVWDDYGISVGDTWDAWNVSGVDTDVVHIQPPQDVDSFGFDLDAEVTGTEDFDYNGTTLSAYVIEVTGDIIFEIDGVDPGDWESYGYQEDFYFVPEFGWVIIVYYEESYGSLVESFRYTLIDTNVPIPE